LNVYVGLMMDVGWAKHVASVVCFNDK
jgi:hypothetical protein